MFFKKNSIFLLIAILMLSLFSACGDSSEVVDNDTDTDISKGVVENNDTGTDSNNDTSTNNNNDTGTNNNNDTGTDNNNDVNNDEDVVVENNDTDVNNEDDNTLKYDEDGMPILDYSSVEPFLNDVMGILNGVVFDDANTTGEFYKLTHTFPEISELTDKSAWFDVSKMDSSKYSLRMSLSMPYEDYEQFINGEGDIYQSIAREVLIYFSNLYFIDTVEMQVSYELSDGSRDYGDYYFSREWADSLFEGGIYSYGMSTIGFSKIWNTDITTNGVYVNQGKVIEVPANATVLTEEQITEMNKDLELYNPDTYVTNRHIHFFSSYYSNPYEMNIADFVFYLGHEDVTRFEHGQDDEFEALKLHPKFPGDKTFTLSEYLDSGFNYYKLPKYAVDDMLYTYMGVTLDDYDFEDTTLYLSDYEMFYTNPSDMGLVGFTAKAGYLTDDGWLVLYNDDVILTFSVDYENNTTYIYSYMPL